MPELIQIKIHKQDEQKTKTPSLKKALSASKIGVPDNDHPPTAYIAPSVLLTIEGETLATRKEISRTFEKHGIRIISMGEKIRW